MPGDIARLVIEIDSNGVVTGKARLEELTDAGKKAEDQNKKHRTSLTELNQGLELARKAFELLKGAVVDSVAEFMEAEKAQVKLESILRATGQAAGKTAQDLNDMASRLAGKTIFDDDAITNAQALMLTFKNVGGEIYDRTIPAVLDLSSAFGMDLAGASVMLGKALEDPTSGLTALRRVGVSFTDQQQEQIKALMDAGEAAKAQGEILDVLKGQVGGVAEAMGASASGSIARMENAVHNLQEAFGRLVATNFQPLIDGLTDVINIMNGSKLDLSLIMKGGSGSALAAASGDQLFDLMRQIAESQAQMINNGAGTPTGVRLQALENLVERNLVALAQQGKLFGDGRTPKQRAAKQPVNNDPGKWGSPSWVYDLMNRGDVNNDPGSGFAPSQYGAQALQDYYNPAPDVNNDPARNGTPSHIRELLENTKRANEEAKRLADTFDRLDKIMQNIAAQGIAQGFQDIGAAMATGASAGDAFGQAMLKMGVQVAEQIGGLLIADGLKMLLETSTLNPMGWAMIAAGGGLELAGGALGASMKSSDSGPRSALSGSSSSSSSQAPTAVTVNNYAGVQVTTTERQTPTGKELQIAIRAAVAGEIAGGGLDRVMAARYGVATPGRSAS